MLWDAIYYFSLDSSDARSSLNMTCTSMGNKDHDVLFFLFAKGNNLTCRLLLVIEQTYLGYLPKQIIRVK